MPFLSPGAFLSATPPSMSLGRISLANLLGSRLPPVGRHALRQDSPFAIVAPGLFTAAYRGRMILIVRTSAETPKPSAETSLLQCLVSQPLTFTLQIRNMYLVVGI